MCLQASSSGYQLYGLQRQAGGILFKGKFKFLYHAEILFYIHSLFQSLRELFANFNRQLVCWVDEWLELTSSELINYDNQLKNAFENVFF